ncbi:helix-turn-helix transcriptional regulator [Clostridium sp.]|uniref:helix-turn-helix domain-containing protein n=1 Tax=Clostridium sp. TaxID=1506 RepID=UPI00291511A8|nr:helix-turn-helix transcriptional regulator [Clostridium sp.]MDU4848510.1 helix-turn-helix transcriptional regulator [Clostridium sp.]
MTLGEKIKFNRNKLNLSQEDLANKCNLSRNAIYNYENNKRTPTISTLISIAEILDISPSDLIDDIDNPTTNIYADKIEMNEAIKHYIDMTTNADNSISKQHELDIKEQYEKYFFKLFNWKTMDMQPKEYFKFILSISPLDTVNHLTECDLDELSVMFSRFVSLKSYERNALSESEKIVPGSSKNYEKNNFLINHTK